ncbi:MAG: hypothetical protein M3426_17415, partial [Actinomycetota bacterium]|nr:hypothetical protein [Actinomycetota bacterium]
MFLSRLFNLLRIAGNKIRLRCRGPIPPPTGAGNLTAVGPLLPAPRGLVVYLDFFLAEVHLD